MATIEVLCPKCSSAVYGHGKATSGEARYRCRGCHHCFQLNYRYEANRPGVAERIIDMAMNGSGVRDTGRVLKISPTTVVRHLKNSTQRG